MRFKIEPKRSKLEFSSTSIKDSKLLLSLSVFVQLLYVLYIVKHLRMSQDKILGTFVLDFVQKHTSK